MVRTHNGIVVFDDEEDIIYSPFYHGRNARPGDRLSAEILAYHCNVANPLDDRYESNLSRIDDDTQIFIWGHGNTRRNCLGGEDGTTATATEIVDDFVHMHLPLAFAGVVVLWSCFAGVPGGFGEALLIHLRARGYRRLRLFAPRVATGGLARLHDSQDYKGLLIFGTGASRNAGALDASASAGIVASMPGWNGTRMLCGPADLRRLTATQRLTAEV